MKEKNLQPRLPSKDLIQIRWRSQKLFRQAKAKRIQQHQTSFTTNAKENSLGRTKYFTICMETQKTLNSQSNLEKEKWSWKNQAPGLQTILQSYSNQDSMVLAQKQKYRSMVQDRKRNPYTYGYLINL